MTFLAFDETLVGGGPRSSGAVTDAEAELAEGGDPELRKLAEDIEEDQQREFSYARAPQRPELCAGHARG